MEGRAPLPVQPGPAGREPGLSLPKGRPALSFSLFWMYYFFGLKSRDAEFMQ